MMNESVFTPEDVKKGLLDDLLKYLVNHNSKSEKSYYEIRISTDGYCTIVSWVDIMYDMRGDSGRFEYLEPDQVVMREILFPDNHIEYLQDGEIQESVDNFFSENPDLEESYVYNPNSHIFKSKFQSKSLDF